MARILPDSAVSIVNFDPMRNALNVLVTSGIDPCYVDSYEQYYARLNPWTEFWSRAAPGGAYISERDWPARKFHNTEFYNDWLAPQKNREAASGMRLDVDRNNMLQISWHYDLANAPEYDEVAAALLLWTKPAIADAVRISTQMRGFLESTQRQASLIEHVDGAAILVDRGRRIHHANGQALEWLVDGAALVGAGDILTKKEAGAQKWLEEVTVRLAHMDGAAEYGKVFRVGERVVRLAVSRQPSDAHSLLLLPPSPLILVVARLLVGGDVTLAEADLRIAFGLSSSESRLCEILANGRSINEASKILGVSDGTARQRLKLVFEKTATHRQGELISMLNRFAL